MWYVPVVPASGQNVEHRRGKSKALASQRREGLRVVAQAQAAENAVRKQVKGAQVRNLRRLRSSRCLQARRRVFRVAGIP